MGPAGPCHVEILCLSATQPQQHSDGLEITAFLKTKRGCVPGSSARMVLPLAAWPESTSWTGRCLCTDAPPNLTVLNPLLSRKSPLHALLSQQLSFAYLWQTSVPKPIPHCLRPLWCSLLSLKPQACSSHQRPSPFLLRGGWCHHCPSHTVTYSCRTGNAEKGKCLGERWSPVTTALSPLSQRAWFSMWGVTLQLLQVRRWSLPMESPSWLNAFQDWPDAIPL